MLNDKSNNGYYIFGAALLTAVTIVFTAYSKNKKISEKKGNNSKEINHILRSEQSCYV